jgi:hypothetical protein
VSVKQRIFLLSIIFSTVGASVSAFIVAVGGGFSGTRPSILDPPTQADLWTVGKTPLDKFALQYIVSSNVLDGSASNYTVWLNFSKIANANWNVSVSVNNGTYNDGFVILLSQNQLSRIGSVNRENDRSLNLLDKSIFAIRDLSRGPKYLILGALWDKIQFDPIEVPVKITDRMNLHTEAGTFGTFVLSYDVGPEKSQIWINRHMPLPIRALVYDSSGQLQYRYQLVHYEKLS